MCEARLRRAAALRTQLLKNDAGQCAPARRIEVAVEYRQRQ